MVRLRPDTESGPHLRDQVETVAFTQIACMKLSLLRPLPAEVRNVEGVHFAVMILVVFASTWLDGRIEQIPALRTLALKT